MNWTENAGFFFGAGLMGVAAGLGLGGTAPNKWALILGLASLYRANSLEPVVDITPRDDFVQSLPQVPSFPSVEDVRGQIGFNVQPGVYR